MFPVMLMCGHRCGLHITATTAIYHNELILNVNREENKRDSLEIITPLAVRTGLALSWGTKSFLCSNGTAAIISTSLGEEGNPYFDEI